MKPKTKIEKPLKERPQPWLVLDNSVLCEVCHNVQSVIEPLEDHGATAINDHCDNCGHWLPGFPLHLEPQKR